MYLCNPIFFGNAKIFCSYKTDQTYHPSQLLVVLGTLNQLHFTEQTLIYGVTHHYRSSTLNAQSLRDYLAIIMLERDFPATNEAVNMISWQNYDGNLSKYRNMENLTVTAFVSNKEMKIITFWKNVLHLLRVSTSL